MVEHQKKQHDREQREKLLLALDYEKEATKRICELPAAGMAHIPIVAMIANAFADDQKRALDAGMNGFITKPIDVD